MLKVMPRRQNASRYSIDGHCVVVRFPLVLGIFSRLGIRRLVLRCKHSQSDSRAFYGNSGKAKPLPFPCCDLRDGLRILPLARISRRSSFRSTLYGIGPRTLHNGLGLSLPWSCAFQDTVFMGNSFSGSLSRTRASLITVSKAGFLFRPLSMSKVVPLRSPAFSSSSVWLNPFFFLIVSSFTCAVLSDLSIFYG